MVSSINSNPNLLANLQASMQPKTAESNRILSQSLAKAMPGVIQLTDKQSPETTASNILKHVQNGLNSLRAQGASDVRLEERWKAAQEGIEKGYKEATEMLKGLGLYDDELKQGVDAGRKLVDDGMDALLKGIRQPTTSNTLAVGKASSLAMSNQFSLDILTREGDRITVNFSQGMLAEKQGSESLLTSQQNWNMNVQGHLSGAEKDALSSLFSDVQNLAERFFKGDIGGALENAMNLGFDGKQLASMSLNLTQTLSMRQTSPYSAVREQLPTPELESLKAPLASYVDSYVNALKKAEVILPAVPQTIQALMEKMLPDEPRLSIWQSFHDGLAALLAAQKEK